MSTNIPSIFIFQMYMFAFERTPPVRPQDDGRRPHIEQNEEHQHAWHDDRYTSR